MCNKHLYNDGDQIAKIFIRTVRSLWTWLWGRYHVPQNVHVLHFNFLSANSSLLQYGHVGMIILRDCLMLSASVIILWMASSQVDNVESVSIRIFICP